jgi:hypothetical protein
MATLHRVEYCPAIGPHQHPSDCAIDAVAHQKPTLSEPRSTLHSRRSAEPTTTKWLPNPSSTQYLSFLALQPLPEETRPAYTETRIRCAWLGTTTVSDSPT